MDDDMMGSMGSMDSMSGSMSMHGMDDDGHNHGHTGGSDGDYCSGASPMGSYFSFSAGEAGGPCTNLWFKDWTLDSEQKVVMAGAALFFAAILHELLQLVTRWVARRERAHLRAAAPTGPKDAAIIPQSEQGAAGCSDCGGETKDAPEDGWAPSPAHLQALECVMYGLRVALGQLLMLVSMTFSSALFVPMVAGFAVGRFFTRAVGTEGSKDCSCR